MALTIYTGQKDTANVVTKNPLMPSPLPRPRSADELIRIRDLSQIADQDVSLSMDFAVDTPNQTFKTTWLQLVNYIKSEVINNIYQIGDVFIGTNGTTPQQRGLTGTWEEIEPDTVLSSVSSQNEAIGDIEGYNSKNITAANIPAHKHSISNHTHSFSANTNSTGSHTHTGNVGTGGSSFEHHQNNSRMPCTVWDSKTGSAGSHSHSLSGTTGSAGAGDTGNTGSGESFNVQSKRLNCVFWIKVSL